MCVCLCVCVCVCGVCVWCVWGWVCLFIYLFIQSFIYFCCLSQGVSIFLNCLHSNEIFAEEKRRTSPTSMCSWCDVMKARVKQLAPPPSVVWKATATASDMQTRRRSTRLADDETLTSLSVSFALNSYLYNQICFGSHIYNFISYSSLDLTHFF